MLTLVRIPAGYLYTPDTAQGTCRVPAPLLTATQGTCRVPASLLTAALSWGYEEEDLIVGHDFWFEFRFK